MAKNLVIVESPAKAKTIQNYLGKDFEVVSSFGHIADLPKKNMGIDLENNFEPIYEVTPDKKQVVEKLYKLAKKAQMIWLATDEDREGEAISWHLSRELKLSDERLQRIVFHEITKKAITKAIENPRKINYDLVDAQQARRVLDRLVGFELSPVLWLKIKAGLSAGRVQSVAVRLIVEREAEIQRFASISSFRVNALFQSKKGESLKAQLEKDFEDQTEAKEFLSLCRNKDFEVIKIEKKPSKKSPSAPFTTSTLQQEASSKLGFSISKTMLLAQQLYEEGHITYMRTDSFNLSNDAIDNAKKQILSLYGEKYSNPKQYATKNKSAQEAHEAIRPTDFSKTRATEEASKQRLYELIYKRTLASQASDAILDKTTIRIQTPSKLDFIAKGETIAFDGFLRIYNEGKQDLSSKEVILPNVEKGEVLKYEEITAREKFSKHPPRYSEAMLVKTLEELGIGRPSTYVPTISTIQKRNYVQIRDQEGFQRDYKLLILKENEISEIQEKENTGAEKSKMAPTDIGLVVNEFLKDHFGQILDYKFTATLEESFDGIARGEKIWKEVIGDFYKNFQPTVADVKKNAEKNKGERLLGEDPKSNKKVFAKIGRYGPMIQIGETEGEEKPKFTSLLEGQHIHSITLEEALKLFELPRILGNYKEKEVLVNRGRFGPYVKYEGKFISIKVHNPFEITLSEAIELIEAKNEEEKNRVILIFENENPKIEVLNGRYGPYIKQEKNNYKIPKNLEAKSLTLKDCKKIIAESKKIEKKNPPKKDKKTPKK